MSAFKKYLKTLPNMHLYLTLKFKSYYFTRCAIYYLTFHNKKLLFFILFHLNGLHILQGFMKENDSVLMWVFAKFTIVFMVPWRLIINHKIVIVKQMNKKCSQKRRLCLHNFKRPSEYKMNLDFKTWPKFLGTELSKITFFSFSSSLCPPSSLFTHHNTDTQDLSVLFLFPLLLLLISFLLLLYVFHICCTVCITHTQIHTHTYLYKPIGNLCYYTLCFMYRIKYRCLIFI